MRQVASGGPDNLDALHKPWSNVAPETHFAVRHLKAQHRNAKRAVAEKDAHRVQRDANDENVLNADTADYAGDEDKYKDKNEINNCKVGHSKANENDTNNATRQASSNHDDDADAPVHDQLATPDDVAQTPVVRTQVSSPRKRKRLPSSREEEDADEEEGQREEGVLHPTAQVARTLKLSKSGYARGCGESPGPHKSQKSLQACADVVEHQSNSDREASAIGQRVAALQHNSQRGDWQK